MRKKWIVDPMFSSETLLPYCFWRRAFMGSFNKGRCGGLWCADGGGRLGLCCWIPDGCIQGEQITFSLVFTSPPLFHVNSTGALISCPSREAGSHFNFILAAINTKIFASETWHYMIKWGKKLEFGVKNNTTFWFAKWFPSSWWCAYLLCTVYSIYI